MRAFAALEAKNRFGELLDAAQREPVTIEKRGRPVAVMMSKAEYDELQALRAEHLRAEILEGVSDIAAGRLIDGEKAFSDVLARLDSTEL